MYAVIPVHTFVLSNKQYTLQVNPRLLHVHWEGSYILSNDKRYYIDDYAPDSYHEVGDYAVLPVFVKPFRKKNGDPSYSLSVQKAYKHQSKGESF